MQAREGTYTGRGGTLAQYGSWLAAECQLNMYLKRSSHRLLLDLFCASILASGLYYKEDKDKGYYCYDGKDYSYGSWCYA